MNNGGRQGIRRSHSSVRNYGDSKEPIKAGNKNYRADADRTDKKLRSLLCSAGGGSDGEACRKCESPCKFGKEYTARKARKERG